MTVPVGGCTTSLYQYRLREGPLPRPGLATAAAPSPIVEAFAIAGCAMLAAPEYEHFIEVGLSAYECLCLMAFFNIVTNPPRPRAPPPQPPKLPPPTWRQRA